MKKFTAIFMYVWVLVWAFPAWAMSMVLVFLLSLLGLIVVFRWGFSKMAEELHLPLSPLVFLLMAEEIVRYGVREAFRGK